MSFFLLLGLIVIVLFAGLFHVNQLTFLRGYALGALPILALLLTLNWPKFQLFRKKTASENAGKPGWRLSRWQLSLFSILILLFGQSVLLITDATHKSWNSWVFGFTLLSMAMNLAGLAGVWGTFHLRKTGQRFVLSPEWMKVAAVTLIAIVFATWCHEHIRGTSALHAELGRFYCLFDDAMVSMRYAWNLSHGDGLVWNLGERVEGYTTLLMVLYMSLGTLVLNKSQAVLFVQISGILFILAVATIQMKILREVMPQTGEERRPFYQVLAFASALFYYPLAFWSVLGMETGLLCLIATSATVLAIRKTAPTKVNVLLPLLLGLMVLTRPDAVVQAGLLLGYRGWSLWRQPNALRIFALETILFLSLPLLQMGFRLGYYGEWLPNTYYLKLEGLSLKVKVGHGWVFVGKFLVQTWPVLLLAGIGTAVRFTRAKLVMLALMISTLVYQVLVGGDPWAFWRIMAPYVPFMFILALAGMEGILDHILPAQWFSARSVFRRSGLVLALVTTVWLTTLTWSNAKFLPEVYYKQNEVFGYCRRMISQSIRLNEWLKPSARVGVFWAGTIPYYTGLYAHDFLGKSDKYIARLPSDPALSGIPGHNKYHLAYSIRRLRPDFVQNAFYGKDNEKEFVNAHYDRVRNLYLLRDSEHVRWERVPRP